MESTHPIAPTLLTERERLAIDRINAVLNSDPDPELPGAWDDCGEVDVPVLLEAVARLNKLAVAPAPAPLPATATPDALLEVLSKVYSQTAERLGWTIDELQYTRTAELAFACLKAGYAFAAAPAPLADAELAELAEAQRGFPRVFVAEGLEIGTVAGWRIAKMNGNKSDDLFAQSITKVWNALPGLLARLAAAETLGPINYQPWILLSKAVAALDGCVTALEKFKPTVQKWRDGDLQEGFFAILGSAKQAAESARPVLEKGNALAAQLMEAAIAGKEPARG